MAITDVNPDLVKKTANDTFIGMGELEQHLAKLAGIQTVLKAAYRGHTGKSLQHVMGEAIEEGKHLAKDLQQIIDVMNKNGVNFNENDLQGAQLIAARMGADGRNSTVDLNWS